MLVYARPYSEFDMLSADTFSKSFENPVFQYGNIDYLIITSDQFDITLYGYFPRTDPGDPDSHFSLSHRFDVIKVVESSTDFGWTAQVLDITIAHLLSSKSFEEFLGVDLNRTVGGGFLDDTLLGGYQHDYLDGGVGIDHMIGRAGDDTYSVDNAGDIVDESNGSGIDTVYSDVAFSLTVSDTVRGDVENLILRGTADSSGFGNFLDNTIIGNSGRNTLNGASGDDDLYGKGGADLLHGSMGADNIIGGTGDDTIFGQGGSDKLQGGRGADILDGGGKADILRGGGGDDMLYGGKGPDKLNGGGGNDIIEGGPGRDKLKGGAGADTFLFASAKHSKPNKQDVIQDFRQKQDDVVDLSGIRNKPLKFIGEDDFSGSKGELRFDAKKKNTFVYGDVDGDGKADFAIKLKGSIDLVKDDFVL